MGNKNTTKTIIIIVAVAAAVLTIFVLVWSIVPKYPSPDYHVDSYEELSDAVGSLCVLPEENILGMEESSYLVLLMNRYSSRPMGYTLWYQPNDKITCNIQIDCRALVNLHYELTPLNPSTTYEGIELEVNEYKISFIMNGFLYQIIENGDDESATQAAVSVAQNIIDNYTSG